MTATLTKWYEEHGRHEIFAGGKKVGMAHQGHKLQLNLERIVARPPAPASPTASAR